MAAGEGYLPPVVAQLLADSGAFMRKITDAKAMLQDFAKTQTQTHLGADLTELETSLTAAKTQLLDLARQVTRARIGADAAPFWADIARLRAELGAMSPLEINVDANVRRVLAEMAAMRGGLALAGVDSLLGGMGGGAGGGGKTTSEASWFWRRVTGKDVEYSLLTALGMGGGLAQVLSATLPLTLSLASALFAAAAGMTALGVAAAPTVAELVQGVSAVNSATDALNVAIVGTKGWATAATNLSSAWAGIPSALQPAVRAILNALGAGSPIQDQIQGFVVHWAEAFAGMVGHGTFDPLILATMKALNEGLSRLMSGGGGLTRFVDALAKMVGPAIHGLGELLAALGHIATAFAGFAMGGEGLQLIVSALRTLGDLLHTGFVQGLIAGMVGFDRTLLSVLTDIMHLISWVTTGISKVPLLSSAFHALGKGIEIATGAALGLGAALKAIELLTGRLGLGSVLGKGAASSGASVMEGWAASAAGGAAGGEAVASKGLVARLASFLFGSSEVGSAGMMAAVPVGLLALLAALPEGKGPDVAPQSQSVKNLMKYDPGYLARFGQMGQGVQTYSAQITRLAAAMHVSSQAAVVLSQDSQTLATTMGMSRTQALGFLSAMDKNNAALKQSPPDFDTLIAALHQTGGALSGAATGFAAFKVSAVQSVSALTGNLTHQVTTINAWATDAQIAIRRGANPEAVAALAKQAPQDLAQLATASRPQLAKFNLAFAEMWLMAKEQAANGPVTLRQAVVLGLQSQDPAIKTAAQQVAKNLNITATAAKDGLNAANAYVAGWKWGLSNGTGAVAWAAENLAAAVEAATMKKLEHHSPSKVAFRIGLFYAQGLANGLHAGIPMVSQAGAALAQVAVRPLAPGVGRAGGGPSMVNNIHIQVTGSSANPQHTATSVSHGVEQALSNVVRQLRAGTTRG